MQIQALPALYIKNRPNHFTMKATITIALLLVFITSCINPNYNRKTISLSGSWKFELDEKEVGKQEGWFSKALTDSIVLPGTTDENQKGIKNDDIEIKSLTRKYKYIGIAWYQKEVEIPESWNNKTIELFLERTKATEVWVDDKYFPIQTNLLSPHIYDLTSALSSGKHTISILVNNSLELFPTGGSHAISEHTQTNWNGIIGRIELIAKDKVNIASVKVYPDVDNKLVKLRLKIINPGSENLSGKIICIANGFNGNNHNALQQSFDFSSDEKEFIIEGNYEMGDDFALWDEFNPNLYKITISFEANSNDNNYLDEAEASFGMVKFETKGTQIVVNDRIILLRGKHDACVFPLTAYPPMTKDEWIRQMKISKEYGLNHYRFHSWTPPKAAFEAADIVGIYMQPELPQWRDFKEKDTVHYEFQKNEGEKIFDNYANHPSFVMFALGNELGGSRMLMSDIIEHLRAYDGRSLFAQGSNNYYWDPKVQHGEDFFVSARTKKRENNYVNDIRASFAFANDPEAGIINGQFPNTERSFENALPLCSVPAIGHETGQYQVMPNFDEMAKYTGVLEARNFEIFRQRMIDKNMFDYWEELFMASGKHAAICYRDDNEISMRTPKFGGFQILDLQDFPGQGTALIGMLDAFMDSKGLITPEEWRQSCAEQTIQAKMPKLVWQNNEEFSAELILINYGENDIINDKIKWSLTSSEGLAYKTGETKAATFKQGKITTAGTIRIPLSDINNPQNLILKISSATKGIRNQYNVWVYPLIEKTEKKEDIIICRELSPAIQTQLETGAKVLLLPDTASIKSSSVGGLFISDYWCYPMFKGICERIKKPVSPGTLGLLINNQHPVFDNFPTATHSDWQWWSVMKKSRPIILDSTEVTYRPIVQTIDNFDRCSKLGLMFEFSVGEGKLFVCSTDLSDKADYVAQQLLKSIIEYMDSEDFVPTDIIEMKPLLLIFYRNNVKNLNSRQTKE